MYVIFTINIALNKGFSNNHHCEPTRNVNLKIKSYHSLIGNIGNTINTTRSSHQKFPTTQYIMPTESDANELTATTNSCTLQGTSPATTAFQFKTSRMH